MPWARPLPFFGFQLDTKRDCRKDGGPVRKASLDHYFAIARWRAGLSWVRFHDLRHGFASTMAAPGMPARTLMDLGGWKDLAMVLRYMHVSPRNRDLAVKTMDEAFGTPRQRHQKRLISGHIQSFKHHQVESRWSISGRSMGTIASPSPSQAR